MNSKSDIDTRPEDVVKIRAAYKDVEKSLQKAGKLVRTTEAGHYMWAAKHKLALSGLRAAVEILRRDLPTYRE